jgi:hypothetical protein
MFKKLIILVILLLLGVPIFAQSVDTAWVRRYDGPVYGDDKAVYVSVDSLGNVYVTGSSKGNGTSLDITTIKYHPDGDTAWIRRYNGPASRDDYVGGMTLDNSGNVYLTGSIGDTAGSGSDYITIKYYLNGDTAWIRRYESDDGPHYSNDLEIDTSDNVYVTGYGTKSRVPFDYITIKYHPNGDTAWVRRYNGPADSTDYGISLEVDDSGNVYVTGISVGIGTYEDFATIKYYPNGDTAWVRRYNGPENEDDRAYDLVIDDSGNVYVTGYSGSWPYTDYITLKYYPNGDTAWIRRYDGLGNGHDFPWTNAVDNLGNVFVTGRSEGSGTGQDYATIKYYPNGDTAWVRRYNGPGNSYDEAFYLAVDNIGNVYVTGSSGGQNNQYPYNEDYATIKYYPNGDTAWVRRYNGPADSGDVPFSVAVDNSGSVYVTGYSRGNGTGDDYATIKYIEFLRGDANKDGKVTVADVVYLINYLFKGGPVPIPGTIVGDANCDGKVTVADVVYLINYLFKGGPPPCS